MTNIDTILRGATLLVLLIILYIMLPVTGRYEYKLAPLVWTVPDSATGVVVLDSGWEPATPGLQRRRKW
jgi:hypothetical protein